MSANFLLTTLLDETETEVCDVASRVATSLGGASGTRIETDHGLSKLRRAVP